MTKEEAIKILRIRKEYVTLIKEDVLQEALDMAIEALSAEPQLDVYAQEYKAYRESLEAEAKGGDALMPKATSVMRQIPSKDGSNLISRAELLKTVQHPCNQDGEWSTEEIVAIIEIMPSASTDRPSGEWIEHKGKWVDLDFYPTKYECNQCHYYVDEGYDSIFCPNCGARMENTK